MPVERTAKVPGTVFSNAILRTALYRRDVRGAIEAAVSIVDERPTDGQAIRSLARLLCETGDFEGAAPYWSRLWSLEPLDLEAAFHRAKAEIATGRHLDAVLAQFCTGEAAKLRPVLEPLLSALPVSAAGEPIRHVAIAGVSYCGSTLLDRLLGGLPGVRSIGESHWLIKSYENKNAAPIDFTAPHRTRFLNCTVCGPHCRVLTLDFRARLAADRSNWYFRIARQLGTSILVSADKNPGKLIENDPLLRMDLLVLFKSPPQAWVSHLDKLPKGRDAKFYLSELERYMAQWCRTYEAFLDQFRPAGKIIFVSFDEFVSKPAETLRMVCASLELPFDQAVLRQTRPGHAIGGNGRAMSRLRENAYEVRILPLAAPEIAPEHVRAIEADGRMLAAHERMMESFRATMKACKCLALEPPARNELKKEGSSPQPALNAGLGAARVQIRDRVERMPLPDVSSVHLDGIFGDFGDNIRAHIAKLEQTGAQGEVKIRFFKHLLSSVDSEEYALIQETYINPASIHRYGGTLKYLDPVRWFEAKLNAALRIDLHRLPPLDILDLGTGPGHFPAVAQYFGHRVVASDIQLPQRSAAGPGHPYNSLCEIYGVKRVELRIDAFRRLPEFGRRFDLVTAFMSNFNSFDDRRPWTVDAWRFFLSDLWSDVLRPGGALYLQLTNGRITKPVWDDMASLAKWSDPASRLLYIEARPNVAERAAPV